MHCFDLRLQTPSEPKDPRAAVRSLALNGWGLMLSQWLHTLQ